MRWMRYFPAIALATALLVPPGAVAQERRPVPGDPIEQGVRKAPPEAWEHAPSRPSTAPMTERERRDLRTQLEQERQENRRLDRRRHFDDRRPDAREERGLSDSDARTRSLRQRLNRGLR